MTPENFKFHTERLNSIQREETEISNTNCRYAVNTIIATVLGLLIKDNIATTRVHNDSILVLLILFLVLLIAVVFYCVESWKRYEYANNATMLYNNLLDGKITDDSIITTKMREQSNKSFAIYKYQLYMCALMVMLLLVYIVIDVINYA